MKKAPKFALTPEQQAIVAELRRRTEADRPELIAESQRVFAAHQALQVELRGVFWLLRAVRKVQGVSLNELARRTGIGKPALSRLENDPAPNVQLNTLQRIAAALGKEIRISVGDMAPARPRRVAVAAR